MFNSGNNFIDSGGIADIYGVATPKTLYQALLFCTKSQAIANLISPGVSVRAKEFKQEVLGYAKPEKNVAFVNVHIFSDKFYDELGIDKVAELRAALSVLFYNYVMVHEASHCLLTHPSDIKSSMYDAFGNNDLINNSYFTGVVQVCEDMYIEHVSRIEFPFYHKFVDNANWFCDHKAFLNMFNVFLDEINNGNCQVFDSLFSEGKLGSAEYEEAAESFRSAVILSAFGMLRNVESRVYPHIRHTREAFEILENEVLLKTDELMTYNSFVKRLRTYGDVFCILFGKPGESVNEVSEQMQGSASLEDMVNEINELIGESIGSKPSSILGENGEEFSNPDYKITADTGEEIDMAEASTIFNAIVVEEEGRFKQKLRGNFKFAGGEVEFEYTPFKVGSVVYEIDKDFLSFGKHLQYAKASSPKTSIPMKSGTKINKRNLHRIVTDGKVFHTPNFGEKQGIGKPEIIFLLDISGSTIELVKEKSKCLYQVGAEAIYGSVISLRGMNVPNSVYAHTASGGRDNSKIFGIASYKMPFPDESGKSIIKTHSLQQLPRLFGQIEEQDKGYNADGNAIAYVSNFFTDKRNKKILIVFSDGLPTAGGGREHEPYQYLRLVVNKLRKDGIEVFSVAMTKNVVKNLNDLYGEEYNILGYEGKLNSELQKLVERLV